MPRDCSECEWLLKIDILDYSIKSEHYRCNYKNKTLYGEWNEYYPKTPDWCPLEEKKDA